MKTRPIPVPKDWKRLKPHPLADLVEFRAGIDLDGLVDHMRKHGYDADEAIILHDGKILDGRHRLLAAIKAGVTPTFKLFQGQNAMAYVAKKLFRQHLDASQRALMAATLAKVYVPPKGEEAPNVAPTLEQVAGVMNVSPRSVDRARAVLEHGTSELQEAVRSGSVSVSDAAKVATQPPGVQNRAVKDVQAGKASTASEAAGFGTTRRSPATQPQSIFCARCQRVGPVKGCEGCKAARAAARGHPLREPGDDTASILQARQEARRSGKPVWDDVAFDRAFGALYRQIDEAGRPYGQHNTSEADALRQKLLKWRDDLEAWLEAIATSNKK
jgi:hypothetical protein